MGFNSAFKGLNRKLMFSLQRQKEVQSLQIEVKNMRYNIQILSRSYVLKSENKVIQKSSVF